MKLKFAIRTDVGKVRKNNEDYYIVVKKDDKAILAVADGMGGLDRGGIASQLTCQILADEFVRHNTSDAFKFLSDTISKANEQIYKYSIENSLKGIGTTLTAILIYDDNLYYANIGDSRLYLYENNELKQLTKDHSFVQFLLDRNLITPQQAINHPKRNLITRAIGIQPTCNPDIVQFPNKITVGQKFLLCTDGLYNSLTDDEIKQFLLSNIDLDIISQALLSNALEKGGDDNITFVLIEIL